MQSKQSRKTSIYAGSYQGFGDVKSFRNQEYWAGINYRPINSLAISFSPDYSITNNELQYVSEQAITNDPRYIFARINQKTASFTFRINYTFTPELSLEYYGQPFVSAGKYTEFKRVTSPKADRFRDRYNNFSTQELSFSKENNSYSIDEDHDGKSDYSFDNPDFNFQQFRSNLVLRWEYRPGSTLFFVWSQGRTNSVSNGSFDYDRDMRDLFGVTPHNVFLIKFSYWFSL